LDLVLYFCSWFIRVVCQFSFFVEIKSTTWIGFGLIWFGLMEVDCNSFLSLCVDFSGLGVQGDCSFESIYWLIALGDLSAQSLTISQTLVSCSSIGSSKHLQSEVLHDYHCGWRYWLSSSQRGLLWCAVLNPVYQTANSHKTSFIIGVSIGVGLTDRLKIGKSRKCATSAPWREVPTCYSTLGYHSKLLAEDISNGPVLLIYEWIEEL